jgi:aspartate-semialdehyde dehydrogenase
MIAKFHNKQIAIVGATGRVGREMLRILVLEKKVPYENIHCFASERSDGMVLDDRFIVRDVASANFEEFDVALFSAGSDVSKIYAIKASKSGCISIDNTSYFRMCEDISLIVPEINFDDYAKYQNKLIIANPNCSTIQMVLPLKPLHDLFHLTELVVSTYQAVSGAGQKGVDELLSHTGAFLNKQSISPSHFKKEIAFNVIPQIDSFTDSLYTKEELKMMNETRKILGLGYDDVQITATCVRVPVIVGHSVSVFAKFKTDINIEAATEALNEFSGITVVDDPANYSYATPIDSERRNDVFVSRIRKHPQINNALSFWCVSDNLRKGAALNAIQIMEELCAKS